jgi:hypothetical protein
MGIDFRNVGAAMKMMADVMVSRPPLHYHNPFELISYLKLRCVSAGLLRSKHPA